MQQNKSCTILNDAINTQFVTESQLPNETVCNEQFMEDEVLNDESLESSIDPPFDYESLKDHKQNLSDELTMEENNQDDENNHGNNDDEVKNDEYFLKKIEELCANAMYLLDQNPGNVELFKVTNTLMDIIVDWRVTNGKQYYLPQKIIDTVLEGMFIDC